MGKINVVIVDATGNKEQKVGLPDDIKCGIIMVKLVEKIKLPSVGPDGNPISYKFIHKVTGRQLLEAQTLGEAGIKDGDVLRLQPEITAGAVCSRCGNNEPDENSFCSKCGNTMAVAAPQTQYTTPQQTYTNNTVYPPVTTNTATDKSKLIFILGIVAVSLYAFGQLILGLGDIDDTGLYNFLYLLIDAGQAIFMLDVVLYMVEKLRKRG